MNFDSKFGVLNSEFSQLMGKDMDFESHRQTAAR